MVKRTGGSRRKTRQKYRRNVNDRGKVSIRNYLQQFNIGEKVLLNINPSIHKGVYFRRYHSKTGIVKAKRGSCYEVSIMDGKKEKTAIVHPIHLTKQ